MKSVRRIAIIFLALCLIFFTAMLFGHLKNHNSTPEEIKIFADLSEINVIDDGNISGRSLLSSDDPFLVGLEYVGFFGEEYTAENVSFMLFAYSFADKAYAQEYFANVTGLHHDLDSDFNISSDGTAVVINGCSAYSVHASSMRDIYDALNYLNTYLSVSLFKLK